jgi:hypothetical protein
MFSPLRSITATSATSVSRSQINCTFVSVLLSLWFSACVFALILHSAPSCVQKHLIKYPSIDWLESACGIPQAWYGAGLLSLWSKGRVGSIPTSRAIFIYNLMKTVIIRKLYNPLIDFSLLWHSNGYSAESNT